MVTDSKTHTFTTLSNKFKLIILYYTLAYMYGNIYSG